MDPCGAMAGGGAVGGACRWYAPVHSWTRLEVRGGSSRGSSGRSAQDPHRGRGQETPGVTTGGGEREGAGGLVRVEWEPDEHRRGVTWPRCPVAVGPRLSRTLQGSGPDWHVPGLRGWRAAGSPDTRGRRPPAELPGAVGRLSSWLRVEPCVDVEFSRRFLHLLECDALPIKHGPW